VAIRCTYQGGTGNQAIGATSDQIARVVGTDASVYLKDGRTACLVEEFSGSCYLASSRLDERLASKSRVDGHDEQQIQIQDHFFDSTKGRRRIQGDSGLGAEAVDLLDEPIEMLRGLTMDGDQVGSGTDERLDVALWFHDHEMDVQWKGDGLAKGGHNVWAEGNVGDELAVHDVYVDDAGAETFQVGGLLSQFPEVGAQNGRSHAGSRHVRHNVLWAHRSFSFDSAGSVGTAVSSVVNRF